MRIFLTFLSLCGIASAWREQRGVKFPPVNKAEVPPSYASRATAEAQCDARQKKCGGVMLVGGRYQLRRGKPLIGGEDDTVWLKNGPTPNFDEQPGQTYLRYYSKGKPRFKNRREAEKKCIAMGKGCGGFTLYRGSYSLRKGKTPTPARVPRGRTMVSWVKNEVNLGNNRGALSHDACKRDNGGCDIRTTCIPAYGGTVQCGLCPAGFTGLGDGDGCIDVDECAVNNGGCDRLTRCTNLMGKRACGVCPKGYQGNGEEGCKDVDECKTNNGGCDGLVDCLNTDGGFICGQCPEFYTGNGLQGCRDKDECLKNNGGCDYKAQCINTPGGRKCGACPLGYTGDGETGCIQKEKGEGQANTTRPETYAKMVRRITDGASDRALHLILSKRQQLEEQQRAKAQVAIRKVRVTDILERTKALEEEIEKRKQELANQEWDADLKKKTDIDSLARSQADRLYKAHAKNPITGGDGNTDLSSPSEDLLAKLNDAIANLH